MSETPNARCRRLDISANVPGERRVREGSGLTTSVRWVRTPLARTGKDAAQPVAGFVHRGAGFVDDADPEDEAVIDAVITR